MSSYIFEIPLVFNKSLRSKLVEIHTLVTQSQSRDDNSTPPQPTNSDYDPHIILLKGKVSSEIPNFPECISRQVMKKVFQVRIRGYKFGDNGLTLNVVPSQDLFEFHRKVYDVVMEEYASQGVEILEEYKPSKWSPRFELVENFDAIVPADEVIRQRVHAVIVMLRYYARSTSHDFKGDVKVFPKIVTYRNPRVLIE